MIKLTDSYAHIRTLTHIFNTQSVRMCAYFSQSLKIKMSKNIVKIAMQFLLNQKNIPQNLLHVLFIFGRGSNLRLITSRIFQISNLPQNSLIHLLSFPVEPPAVFSKILERAFYVSQKHSAVFVAFLLVVVDYLNAWKVQCL